MGPSMDAWLGLAWNGTVCWDMASAADKCRLPSTFRKGCLNDEGMSWHRVEAEQQPQEQSGLFISLPVAFTATFTAIPIAGRLLHLISWPNSI